MIKGTRNPTPHSPHRRNSRTSAYSTTLAPFNIAGFGAKGETGASKEHHHQAPREARMGAPTGKLLFVFWQPSDGQGSPSDVPRDAL